MRPTGEDRDDHSEDELVEDQPTGESIVTYVGIVDLLESKTLEVLTLYGDNYEAQLDEHLKGLNIEVVGQSKTRSYTEEEESDG